MHKFSLKRKEVPVSLRKETVSLNMDRLKNHNISIKIIKNNKKIQKRILNMTLRELIINTLEEESENLLDKELAYFVKDNPDGTFDAITISALGITDHYLLLSDKCPNCDN